MWLQLARVGSQWRQKFSCRSSFLLAAGEQIKTLWRRSTFSPSFPYSLLFVYPFSCSRQLVLFQKSLWKWWNFQALELQQGIYHSRVVQSKDFLLRFTLSIHLSPCFTLLHFLTVYWGLRGDRQWSWWGCKSWKNSLTFLLSRLNAALQSMFGKGRNPPPIDWKCWSDHLQITFIF